jgi:hypothetical protein
VRIMRREVKTLADLDPADCAEVDELMIMRYAVTPEDIQLAKLMPSTTFSAAL